MVSVGVHRHGPVHQVEINIIQPKRLETLIDIGFGTVMPGTPELSGDEDVLALDLALGKDLR